LPSPPELLLLLIQNLGANVSLGKLSNVAAWDRYEAFVWLLVIQAARQEGAQVTLQDVNLNSASAPILRTSPGVISSNAQPYTHAVIVFPGKPILEAHVGIQIAGKSTVPHECDVVVLDRVEAQACRDSGANPRYKSALIIAECKYYPTSNLSLKLSREFLGFCKEMRKIDCFFVASRSSAPVLKVLSHSNCHRQTNVLPNSQPSVSLIHAFREKFNHFNALN
jgi:hypothetical protein